MSIPISMLALLAVTAGGYLVFKLLRGIFWLLGKLFCGIGLFLGHVLGLVKNILRDTVHCAGALVTGIAIAPLALGNLLIARPSQAGYYGRAAEDELINALLSVYRVVLGHPLRFLGLRALVDGLERRLPDLVDRAPRVAKKGGGDAEHFPGYTIVRGLPEGGSGARLFVARPRPEKASQLRETGRFVPAEVVIKAFAIERGSTLPQIVRESRALEAARKLGLVLEHHLSEDRFHYVMPYVRGEELDATIQRLHAQSGPAGLSDAALASGLSYGQDILYNLERFHLGGLWHKDIKPANLIISEERAYLVDFGLVTPLQSAMTLTTHGTEYYRDPEMVRQALQGVKVHEIDGVKFDLYSAGAVLYSIIENSFPAHGSLSRVTKRCPEALEWIVRRSMADIGQRYASAREMRNDLATLAASPDPFAVRPADLPSFHGRGMAAAATVAAPPPPSPAWSPSLGAEEPAQPTREPHVRRRRRRRGLAAVLALIVSLVLLDATLETDNRHRNAYVHSAQGTPAQRSVAFAEEFLEEAKASPLFTDDGSWDPYLDPRLSTKSEDDRTGLERVLVLDDLGNPGTSPLLGSLFSTLEARGYEVLGSFSDSLDDAAGLQLIAGAKKTVGLSDPNDVEAVRRLQSYLDGCDDLDAIVWISQQDDETHVLRCLIQSFLGENAAEIRLDNILAGGSDV